MLTATYTLVSLSVEQSSVRVSLQSLQKLLHSNFLHQSMLTAGQVNYACDALRRIYDTCHWRKIEKFLIPAIRRATPLADQLLLELEQLSHAAAEAMGAIAERLSGIALDSRALVEQFCTSIDTFCNSLLRRIEREEAELFPVARTVISGEAWFSVANQMLAHEAYVQENRHTRHPVVIEHVPARLRRDRAHMQARQQGFRVTLAH